LKELENELNLYIEEPAQYCLEFYKEFSG